MVRNFEIDGADQHALSYIESFEVFLSVAHILFSQNMFDSKTRGENAATFKLFYNSNPKRMPPVCSYEHLLRFVDHKIKQEHVPK